MRKTCSVHNTDKDIKKITTPEGPLLCLAQNTEMPSRFWHRLSSLKAHAFISGRCLFDGFLKRTDFHGSTCKTMNSQTGTLKSEAQQ